MAGGIPYTGVPFTLNVKCIIFSLIIISIFLYKLPPIKNEIIMYFILFSIFTVSYVSMAWYDYYFNCKSVPLQKGNLSLQRFFKPPAHEKEKQEELLYTMEDHNKNHKLIYLSHIFLIVPLLSYIALMKNKTPIYVYYILSSLIVMTLFYHGYKYMYQLPNKKTLE